jgi:hypothetical protein
VIVERFQFLGGGGGSGGSGGRGRGRTEKSAPQQQEQTEPTGPPEYDDGGPGGDDIPF